MSAIIYFDGGISFPSHTKSKNTLSKVSWGIVFHTNDNTIEHSGCIEYGCGSGTISYHELIALFESVQLVYINGLLPDECSFFTDDRTIASAGFHLHEANGSMKMRRSILAQLSAVANIFYKHIPNILDVVIEYLLESRFTKVKSHMGVVYNCRADYLVRQARTNKPLMDLDTWMRSFCKSNSDSINPWTNQPLVLGGAFYDQ
jgi:ribonuclease HI